MKRRTVQGERKAAEDKATLRLLEGEAKKVKTGRDC